MAGIVCYGLARHLIRPIRTLRTSTRRLADGDLTVRVGAAVQKRHDELGDLGRDFDYMAERIDSLVSAQRKLLRDMSHELRSPLARLRVALELARRQTGPEVSGILGRIERETRRLDELIGALLTVARLEGGEIRSERMRIDLAALVHEIVADADFEARSRGRRVSLLRGDACTVVGTVEFLRSAIENVVRNAIRYTTEGTQVEVAVTRQERDGESRAVICVRDHGPGVREDSLQDIFRPFYRVDDDRDRQTGGTGLGLAIAQQAVRLHEGTISAENAQGGGLLVELTLPAAPENSGHRCPAPEDAHHTA
jgi:two-component system sensor histidine kinase CpxA